MGLFNRLKNHIGLVPNPISKHTREIHARVRGADVSVSVCPYCAVGCSQLVYPAIGGHILESGLAAIGVNALDIAQLTGDHFADRALDAAALGRIVQPQGTGCDVVGDLDLKRTNPVDTRVKPLVEHPAGTICCRGLEGRRPSKELSGLLAGTWAAIGTVGEPKPPQTPPFGWVNRDKVYYVSLASSASSAYR